MKKNEKKKERHRGEADRGRSIRPPQTDRGRERKTNLIKGGLQLLNA